MQARAAGAIPHPTLEVTVENFGLDVGDERRESTLSASQQVIGHAASGRVARAEAEAATAEWTAQQREIAAETAEAFLNAWWLERRLEYLARAEHVAEATVAGARERTRIGAAPPVDGRRAEAVLAERMIDRRAVRAELDAARRALALEWGGTRAEFDSLVLPPPSVPELPPPDALMAYLRQNPERLQAAAETAVEIARVREARSLTPELTLSFGARRLEEVRGYGWVAGASAPLPIFSRRASNIRAAEAERYAATARERAVERRLVRELASAYDSLIAARDKEEIVRTRLLPAAREALGELQHGYRAGRFTYLDQLEGQRAALDAEATEVQLLRDIWSARFTLERLLGQTLEAVAGGAR